MEEQSFGMGRRSIDIMELNSPKVSVDKPAGELFEALSDVNNYGRILPDNTTKFEVIDNDTFIFALKGFPEIKLRIKEKSAPGKIVLGAAGGSIPFQMTAYVVPDGDAKSEAQFYFEGQLNAMLAMMAKGPLTSLLNSMAGNLHKL